MAENLDNSNVDNSLSPHYKARAFMVTMHEKCFKNLGLDRELYMNPKALAEKITEIWEASGKERICGVVICESAKERYHAHVACYTNSTTINCVSETLGKAHVEVQKAGKKRLREYLLKEGEFIDKGEKILYSKGIENLQDAGQGKRTDLDDIKLMLNAGAKPYEIFDKDIKYRKYEHMIIDAYRHQRLKEMPLIKDTLNEYHWGLSGTGKTYTYVKLADEVGRENIYLMTDISNGGMDGYAEAGYPDILFIDEFKPNEGISYRQLLNMTDKYSMAQTHCRFHNCYNMWSRCIISSIYAPEQLYKEMVPADRRRVDSIDQFLRRFEYIVYHYKDGDEYKEIRLRALEYKCAGQMEDIALRKQIKKMDKVVKGENPLLTFDRLQAR